MRKDSHKVNKYCHAIRFVVLHCRTVADQAQTSVKVESEYTHEFFSCSVVLPESMNEESRLFANTSGLTSRTQWYVAIRRK